MKIWKTKKIHWWNEISLILWKVFFNDVIFYTKQNLEKCKAKFFAGIICNYCLAQALCVTHFLWSINTFGKKMCNFLNKGYVNKTKTSLHKKRRYWCVWLGKAGEDGISGQMDPNHVIFKLQVCSAVSLSLWNYRHTPILWVWSSSPTVLSLLRQIGGKKAPGLTSFWVQRRRKWSQLP